MGCSNNSTTIDHAVQLVGYGTESGQDYFLIRNSWYVGVVVGGSGGAAACGGGAAATTASVPSWLYQQ
jgi:hypothetical protein